MSVKCTYESCFKRFSSEEAMIKHKIKAPEHDYCAKCKVDCQDDLDYLIHQIQSPKHICCPICGSEFQSAGGRDRHVEINHPAKQQLSCAGCHISFQKASSLMFHIENHECQVIKPEHFQRRRAEKQIEKDAWAEALDPYGRSALPSHADTNVDTDGGVTLLDQSSRGSRDGPGIPSSSPPLSPLSPVSPPLQLQAGGPLRTPPSSALGKTITSIERFPPLPATNRPRTNKQEAHSDLLDLDEAGQRLRRLQVSDGAWTDSTSHAQHLFPHPKQPASKPTESVPDRHHPDDSTHLTAATDGGQDTRDAQIIPPPAVKPSTQDPSAAYAHVQTAPRISLSSELDIQQFFDTRCDRYICPGLRCGRQLKTVDEFRDHLLTGAHITGPVTCPSCLKKFKTTSALIAHCESGSRKCNIRNSTNYNEVIREITGGLIGTNGHLRDGTVRYTAPRIQDW